MFSREYWLDFNPPIWCYVLRRQIYEQGMPLSQLSYLEKGEPSCYKIVPESIFLKMNLVLKTLHTSQMHSVLYFFS